jgi:TRAP-type mannitol/chloroaromatic compound transport system permease small subunit
MKNVALILGVIGGAFGLWAGVTFYGADYSAAFSSFKAFFHVTGTLVPVLAIIGGLLSPKKPSLGAVLMIGAALAMLPIFGLKWHSVLACTFCAAGGIAATLQTDTRHEEGLRIVDQISTFVGKAAGWSILILTFVTSYEVFMRYVFSRPTDWAFDASYMLYGALFMLAGAYALSRNSHVRGDFLYRSWPVRRQASMDLTLYVLFFFPGILALIYSGFGFAELAWLMKERSSASPSGPPVYHFKTLIPVTGALMLMQGIVEFMRCIIAVRDGAWPQRLHDVQELDQQMLQKAEQGEYQTIKDLEELGARKGAV